MAHFVLIACASGKLDRRARADSLYQSSLFHKSLLYSRTLDADGVFILSAKHGLLKLDEEIEPYDLTLNRMPVQSRREWAGRVLRQIAEIADLDRDRFTFLAGARYREHLASRMRHTSVPMSGLPIGKQLSFLSQALAHV